MSFFYQATKTESGGTKGVRSSSRVKEIPIASMNKLSCSVCPRAKDSGHKNPKMRPSGAKSPLVYMLGTSPSEEDDANDLHWSDAAGDAIHDKFGSFFMKQNVRSNYVQQCRGDMDVRTIECCRSRIVQDIEETKPLLVVTIGDEALRWAVPSIAGNAMTHRGQLMVAKIGLHNCWVLPLIYPAFAFKKKGQFGKSEFEKIFEHDVRLVKELIDQRLHQPPTVWSNPKDWDRGLELITGHEPKDFQRLENALADLAGLPKSAIDFETNGLRPYHLKEPLLLTAAVGSFERTVAFCIDHPDGWGTDARRAKARAMLGEYMLHSGRKAAHNLAMEMEWAHYFYGPAILRRTEWDDTMGMCHTLDERPGTKKLEHQILIRAGFNVKAQNNLDVTRLAEYPAAKVLRYNAMDTKWTDWLRDDLLPQVQENAKFQAEYERKLRLAPTLILTQAKGIPIDFEYAEKQQDLLLDSMDALEGKIQRTNEVRQYARRFGPFSPTNADHVLKLMKDVLDRDEVRVEDSRTGAVRWTTEEEALAKIPAKEVPSASMILEHRAVAKLQSTYIKPILDRKIVCRDGLVRSRYGSMVAVTGRLNAEDPNIQNFPKRKHREIRGVVVPPKHHVMAPCDYGQIEFRVVGMASEDANLVKYCWTGYDVHQYWAKRMMEEYREIVDYIVEAWPEVLKAEDQDKAMLKVWRQEAKNGWVFPQLFGSSVRSCAEQLHLPMNIAEDLAGEFWDEFKGVKKWQEKLMKDYERNLYVETLTGRRRRGAMTKNEIINMPIQGTAADIVTCSMDALSERAEAEQDDVYQPAINVHDDLTFWLPEQQETKYLDQIALEMCKHRFDFINVPLVVEASLGKRWHECKEVKVYRSNELYNMRNPYAN